MVVILVMKPIPVDVVMLVEALMPSVGRFRCRFSVRRKDSGTGLQGSDEIAVVLPQDRLQMASGPGGEYLGENIQRAGGRGYFFDGRGLFFLLGRLHEETAAAHDFGAARDGAR